MAKLLTAHLLLGAKESWRGTRPKSLKNPFSQLPLSVRAGLHIAPSHGLIWNKTEWLWNLRTPKKNRDHREKLSELYWVLHLEGIPAMCGRNSLLQVSVCQCGHSKWTVSKTCMWKTFSSARSSCSALHSWTKWRSLRCSVWESTVKLLCPSLCWPGAGDCLYRTFNDPDWKFPKQKINLSDLCRWELVECTLYMN